jgi:hypothetical protein
MHEPDEVAEACARKRAVTHSATNYQREQAYGLFAR